MRTFEKKNVRAFNLFGVLVVIGILILSSMVYMTLKGEDNKIAAYAGTYLYDDENMLVEITKDSEIIRKWDGKYYMTDEEGQTVCLGSNPSLFNQSQNMLSILGECYRIYPDGTTQKYKKGLEISDLKENALYKLKDRVYIFTGSHVASYDGAFETEDFMRVSLDKNGRGCRINGNR